ncbi:dual specificity protein phosphatase 23-like [Saccoglossus kowalevskii]|uniref:Dual specificity protein phosphatase 23-like n=1 Tax=Saccoglossus kowalevskii TaxID=10224 RepID=A0ABM0GU65_SACKO|nr:PREDICTED: dual specificity protein phosphatase 23-like [Saccoglossus kowalevskii]
MATKAPGNFSWVDKGKVAGLAFPHTAEHLHYIHEQGVHHLVTLTMNSPPMDTCPMLKWHRIKMPDFTAPSMDQIYKYLKIVEESNAKGEAVAVHCAHGNGRTGTMLACYLVKTRKISGQDAINLIREIRPGSIEVIEQERAVVQFYQHYKSNF